MQANNARNCCEATKKEESNHCDLLRRSHLQFPDVVDWKQQDQAYEMSKVSLDRE